MNDLRQVVFSSLFLTSDQLRVRLIRVPTALCVWSVCLVLVDRATPSRGWVCRPISSHYPRVHRESTEYSPCMDFIVLLKLQGTVICV